MPPVQFLILFATTACGADPQIDAGIPGGNIVVERIDGDDVWLHQELRDTPRFWFWWHLRVREAAGRTLTFHFTQGNVFGTRGPAVSRDGGNTWEWLGVEACDGDAFTCTFQAGETRLAFAIPYTSENLAKWLAAHHDPHLVRESLIQTDEQRNVDLLRLGRVDGRARKRVLVTARHHACESLAGYVVEGLMDGWLAADVDGEWLCDNVELLVVPIMDVDGVEDGDQGKLRAPHDHWLDYGDGSLYEEVQALKQRFQVDPQNVEVALDVHCPSIRDDKLYFAFGSKPATAENMSRLIAALEAVQSGPLQYTAGSDQPYGRGWNSPSTYDGVKSFMHWAETLPGIRAVATLEFPYASINGKTVTVEHARQFGRDLAQALARDLRQ